MAGKAHGNGDRRGDNTICGLGDRLRRLTAGICLITQTIFPVMAAAPTHINHARSDTATSLILPNVKTIPYTSQTAGISAVTASINSSSQSRNVTFIADVSTAKIADLVVRRSACSQATVPRLLRRSPRSRTARWRSLSPARRRESVRSLPALTAAARAGM